MDKLTLNHQHNTMLHKNETRYNNQPLTWPTHLEVHAYIYKNEPEIIHCFTPFLQLNLSETPLPHLTLRHCWVDWKHLHSVYEQSPPPPFPSKWTLQFNGNSLKHFRKCMALNCLEPTSPPNVLSMSIWRSWLWLNKSSMLITLVAVRLLPIFHLYCENRY